jgi:hypothetical protein
LSKHYCLFEHENRFKIKLVEKCRPIDHPKEIFLGKFPGGHAKLIQFSGQGKSSSCFMRKLIFGKSILSAYKIQISIAILFILLYINLQAQEDLTGILSKRRTACRTLPSAKVDGRQEYLYRVSGSMMRILTDHTSHHKKIRR